MHYLIVAKVWDGIASAASELQFKSSGHHSLLPRPDHGTVIGIGCEVGSVDRFFAISWVRDYHTNRREKTCRKDAHNVVGSLIDK